MSGNRTAIIVGGGIGGLAAAIGLHRIGWSALVLEQAPAFGAVGAGISLWPNALRALDALGVGDEIRALDAPDVESGMRSERGRWLTRTGNLPISILHRADLHAALIAAVPPDWLIAGSQVQKVTPDGEVVYQADGREQVHRAEVVIAADGLHSITRTHVWPEAPGPQFVGRTAWRGVTRPGSVTLTAEGETLGRAGRMGLLQLRGERVYWFAEAHVAEAGVRYSNELGEVRSRFGRWHDPIPRLLDSTDPDAVLHHDIVHLPPLPTYVNGRVALVGDAAHAMTPDLGQGACQALEDVVVLCSTLAAAGPAAALAAYDAERRPRSQRLARASRRVGEFALARSRAGLWMKMAASAVAPKWLIERSMERVSAWDAPPLPGPGRPD